jgi:hypothetical protein
MSIRRRSVEMLQVHQKVMQMHLLVRPAAPQPRRIAPTSPITVFLAFRGLAPSWRMNAFGEALGQLA